MHDNFREIPEKHPIDSIKCDSPPQQNGSHIHPPKPGFKFTWKKLPFEIKGATSNRPKPPNFWCSKPQFLEA